MCGSPRETLRNDSFVQTSIGDTEEQNLPQRASYIWTFASMISRETTHWWCAIRQTLEFHSGLFMNMAWISFLSQFPVGIRNAENGDATVGPVSYVSATLKFKDSDFRSAGWFCGRRQLAVNRLVIVFELLQLFVILCPFEFQWRSCRFVSSPCSMP